jgi:hypothetical protein
MKTKLLVLALLAGGSMFAQTRFSFGINIGGRAPGYYAPVPAYVDARPPYPGPGFTWVDGYWAQNYGRNVWVAGYWTRVPYERAYRYEAPRYERYERGFDRDRDWDRDHDRRDRDDYRRGYGNGFRGR